jgi:hypothetical protein
MNGVTSLDLFVLKGYKTIFSYKTQSRLVLPFKNRTKNRMARTIQFPVQNSYHSKQKMNEILKTGPFNFRTLLDQFEAG